MIERLKKVFGKMNLERRVMALFIIISVFPILVIGGLAVYLSVSNTIDAAREFSESNLMQTKIRIEAILEKANVISYQLADDALIQSSLNKPLPKNISEKYKQDLKMDTYLNNELTYTNELYGAYVIGKNKGGFKSSYNSLKEKDLTQTYWYKRIMESNEDIWFEAHKDSFVAETSGQFFLSRGMKIREIGTNEILGVILIDIKVELFEKILEDLNNQFENVEIYNKRGNQVIKSSHEVQNIKKIKLKGIKIEYDIKDSDWVLSGTLSISNILADNAITVLIIVILVMVMTVLSYFIGKLIGQTITGPIDRIIHQMEGVNKGQFNGLIKVEYDDEIGNLTRKFNIMTRKVQRLIERNTEEQYKLRKSELKALQSQINPHMLYNTLSSVIWMARMGKNEDVVNIVTAMTELFRISLSKGNDIIQVATEIQHVKSYLIIQKYRYEDHFTYEFDIDKEIEKCKIIKLVLQPLVENAIYHGIKEKKGGGHIRIEGKQEKGNIILKVIDTGVGMDQKILLKLQDILNRNIENDLSVYGVKNVNDRIRIFFGLEYGIHYESQLGQGTTAIIVLPKVLGGECNDKNLNH